MTSKVGFCCILLNEESKTPVSFKFKTATVKYASSLTKKVREGYIRNIVENNCRALYEIVNWLSKLPLGVRMFRITSGMFPLYTHESCTYIYQNKNWMSTIESSLSIIGKHAREHNVRLSFHPGAFCVLNSTSEAVRQNSVREFEYHCTLAEMLGYAGSDLHNFAVNVHGGKSFETAEQQLESWAYAWSRLSTRARKLITLENDEFNWSAASILRLCEHYGIRMVFDVHHYWCQKGIWASPHSKLAHRIRATWNDTTPKLHLSLCDPKYLNTSIRDARGSIRKPFNNGTMYDFPEYGTTKLRVHSDYVWASPAVEYVARWFGAGFDIMTEMRTKNLASFELHNELVRRKFIEGERVAPWATQENCEP